MINITSCAVRLAIGPKIVETAKGRKVNQKKNTKSDNTGDGTSGYDNLLIVLLVNQSISW